MQIDHNHQTGCLRPVKSLTEHIVRSLDIRVARVGNHTPVPKGNAHEVETGIGDSCEVGLCNPGIPVVAQLVVGFRWAQSLTESPLVDRRSV